MNLERLGIKLLVFIVASWLTMLLFGVVHAEVMTAVKPIDFGTSGLILGLWCAAILAAIVSVSA